MATATQNAMETAEGVISALNRQAANHWTLYHNYKKYHWQAYGPEFRSLHKLFDKHADIVREGLDLLAERIRMFQKNPVFALEAIPQVGTVHSSTPGFQTTAEMCREALGNHEQMILEMREDIELCDRSRDPGSSDLLVQVLREHEKMAWFLRQFTHPSGFRAGEADGVHGREEVLAGGAGGDFH